MLRLKELREDARISQEKLAEFVGSSKSSISYYESGKREPDIHMLKQLAAYFGVTVDYLIGLSPLPSGALQQEEMRMLMLYRKMAQEEQTAMVGMMDAVVNNREKSKETPGK